MLAKIGSGVSGYLDSLGGSVWGAETYGLNATLDIADGKCIDFDECMETEHNCHKHATCVNSEGSYRCECNAGYRGDGFECDDHNECVPGLHQCPINSHCINNRGSYTCECDHGFHVSTATVPSSGAPISGTNPTGSSIICEDIDECEGLYGPIYCDINADCINTRGSYKCQCKTGYEANSYDGTEGTVSPIVFYCMFFDS